MNIFSQFRIVKIFKILLILNTCLELLLIFFSIVENGNSMQMNAGSMQTDWLHTNTQQNNDQNTGPPKKLQKECVFFLFFLFWSNLRHMGLCTAIWYELYHIGICDTRHVFNSKSRAEKMLNRIAVWLLFMFLFVCWHQITAWIDALSVVKKMNIKCL